MILNLGLAMDCIEADKAAIEKYMAESETSTQEVIGKINETMYLLELAHNVCRYLSRLTDESLTAEEYVKKFDEAVEQYLGRTLGVE